MITSTMTPEEILKEYKLDYKTTLRPYFLRIFKNKMHDIKKKSGVWISLKKEVIVKSPRGNTYKSRLKVKYDKKQGLGFSSVVYMKTIDTKTGRKVVYLFSDDFPIKFSSTFFSELGKEPSELLEYGSTWDVQEFDGERYNAWINFGEEIGAGIGRWEGKMLILKHLVREWKENPIKEYESPKEKSEIDKAWEDYYHGNLDLPFLNL